MLKIYKASAGSGKTYTLAFEFIRTLLGIKKQGSDKYFLNSAKYSPTGAPISNKHRHILAITFTNKATEEMKRRIINELDALSVMPSGPEDASYASSLCQLYGCTRQELADTAALALRQLLYDYHSFNVTTIDSFFQRVLRTFARELDRQGDFNIELNDMTVVQTSVGTMLDDFNNNNVHNPALGDWLYSYLVRKLRSGGKTNFFNRNSRLHSMLVGLVSNICDEKFKPYAERMRAYLADKSKLSALTRGINKRKTDILGEVTALARSLMGRLDADGVAKDLKASIVSNKLISGAFGEGKEVARKDIILRESIEKVVSGETDPFKKSKNVTDVHRALYADTIAKIRDKYVEYYTLDSIMESLDGLGLLGFAWRYLDDFAVENNTVLLSDTNHLLSRIIGKEETPFIYERLGMMLQNFLIDEFQDTSQMQWRNLMPLVANGIGLGCDSLIIGDEKQSIYRFRNSDSSLLHHKVAEDDFPAPRFDTRIAGSGPGENTNHRSAAEVVRFNNSLFRQMSRAHGVVGFENVVQDIYKTDKRGYISFMPVIKESDPELNDGTTPDPLFAMAENMLRQHRDGQYRWRDIAVLVNRHKEAARVVNYLLDNYPDIPVLSDEALYVKKSPAVQLIIGVLKLLVNTAAKPQPTDSAHRYPTPSELAMTMSRFEFFRSKGMSVESALEAAADAAKATELPVGIEAIKSRKASTLPALIETIINEQLTASDRSTQLAYLNAFQDFVADYCAHYNPSIKAFLSYWDKQKDKLAISSSPDMDAVTVMTIHKSKGLEFACVHIPFGSWSENGKPRGQWRDFPALSGIDPGLCPPALHIALDDMHVYESSPFHAEYIVDIKERTEDTMNMTYVAYTRAGAELCVYYDPEKGIGRYIAQAMASSIDENDSRLCDLSKYFNIASGHFEMGEPTIKEQPKNENDSSKKDSSLIHLSKYNVFYHSGAEVLTKVSDMLDLDPDIHDEGAEVREIETYHDEEARMRGIMLHDTLSMIEDHGDIDRAVNFTAMRMRMSTAETADLKIMVDNMIDLSNNHISRWFSQDARVLTEQSVYLPEEPEGKQVRRLDRLVLHPDGLVEVVDYKFTSEEEENHHGQVRSYMKILRSMGYREVKGYLWYPLLKVIKEVH